LTVQAAAVGVAGAEGVEGGPGLGADGAATTDGDAVGAIVSGTGVFLQAAASGRRASRAAREEAFIAPRGTASTADERRHSPTGVAMLGPAKFLGLFEILNDE
jgi:hypothetical protein